MTGFYLVLGASGNLGKRVTARLVSEGKRVKGLVRDSRHAAVVNKLGAETGLFDMEEPQTLTPHLHDVTHIINTSYISFAPNILMVLRKQKSILDKLERLILIGSTGVHTKLSSESAEKKRMGEQSVIESEYPFTILRPTMIYGHARDGNISRLLKCFQKYPLFPVFGNGLSTMQPVHINDVVAAVSGVLKRPATLGKIYDIGGPHPMTYCELLKTAAAVLDRRILFIHIPINLAVAVTKILLTLKISPLTVEQVLRLKENKHVDLCRARIDFAYNPIPFEEGLRLELSEINRQTRLP